MTPGEKKNAIKLDYVLAAIMIVMGLLVAGLSLAQLSSQNSQMAQVTPPAASDSNSPQVPAGNDNGPAESKPGGTRPTTPAPEPARPDADAQKAGAAPALPAAPAEKMGEPIKK
ncbi:MAG: hypothetical protein EKK40_10300 [Bradyrhizobiaceae bacterium]|nr:MAG: hypothetical protein EKK40_10300 [Bradyrhizobiaceae bacterium]